jgi:photosynthetic reaction center cytochrome c subunit
MTAMTAWVAPEQGCTYCHNPANFADDSKYTKVVARRMLEMTQHINADWKTHVAGTGVTCYTCHRGNPVPPRCGSMPPIPEAGADGATTRARTRPGRAVAWRRCPTTRSRPTCRRADIRVNGTTALPTGNRHSIKQTEFTYSLMMHMSTALGVNCTYCHNSRRSRRGKKAAAAARDGLARHPHGA